METTAVINIINVMYGENKNHLRFEGYIPTFDPNTLYEFDFVGNETMAKPTISKELCEKLTKQLNQDFGYAPFELEEARKKLGNIKQYTVKF